MTQSQQLVLKAQFNPLLRPYLVVTIGFVMACTIVGLPLAVIWFLGAGQWWAHHYFDKLECHLGERALRFRKGILVQIEKTIPLDNIQDVTFVEGPILRYFNLSTIKFETAGHSADQASDMHLTGIIDAHDFRNKILELRDALKNQGLRHQGQIAETAETTRDSAAALAALQGIERRLDEIIGLLKNRQSHRE